MTTNPRFTQPQWPRLITRDADTKFYLDRRMDGTGPLELLVRETARGALRFKMSSAADKNELVRFIDRTLAPRSRQEDDDTMATDEFVVNFDRRSYQFKGVQGTVTISRPTAKAIADELRRITETGLAEITRRAKNVTTNTTTQEPQFPYVVARDATASFYLDREKTGKGHLELICRKAGGEESKLTLPYGRNRHIVNFVSGNIDRNHDGSDASGIKLQLDRYAYKIEWSGGEMEVSKESMARICLELQKYG